jgi:hypothetical protein
MDQRPVSRGEPPRSEPEILPPEESIVRTRWADDDGGVHRVYVAKVGPFGFILMALVLAAIAAVVAIFVVGAFLIVIPLAGLLLAAAIIGGLWRGPFRRMR